MSVQTVAATGGGGQTVRYTGQHSPSFALSRCKHPYVRRCVSYFEVHTKIWRVRPGQAEKRLCGMSNEINK